MARGETVREQLQRVLREAPATARDLSKLVGIPERDVVAHLPHVARSLQGSGSRLLVEPPTCLECGFEFTGRTRYSRPSRCPECRGTRTILAIFRIESP